jgi:serine protease Do
MASEGGPDRPKGLPMTKRFHALLLLALLSAGCQPALAGDPMVSRADVVAKLLPQVVNISIVKLVRPPPGQAAANASADLGGFTPKRSLGSGFIIDPSGIILTNKHVIDGASEINVILHDGTRLRATVMFRAPIDLAILKVNTLNPLPAIKWGDSDAMRPGDPVIAIGNPLGLGGSVSSGIVSALDRDIKVSPYDSFIQTDAAINHGNSGGPLFNIQGEVIGVNTALYSSTDEGGSVGLGFSIPGNDAQFVLNSFHEFGRVRAGSLGAPVAQVTNDMADSVGLPGPWGEIVTDIPKGGAAAKAGLRAGDIILQVGDVSVKEVRALNRLLAATPIGEVVQLTVFRDGATVVLPLTVTEVASPPGPGDKPPPMPPMVMRRDLGLTMEAINDRLRRSHALPPNQRGVVVTGVVPNSVAAARGVMPGDVIVKAQLKDVATPAEVLAQINGAREQKRGHVLLVVEEKTGLRWVTLPLQGSGL